MHNKMVCHIQPICKKLNFHYGMKTTVTLSNTHMLCCLFQLHETHQDMHTCKIKSVTMKRCNSRYTYIRNCSSTIEMKHTTTQQGWSMINTHRKPVTAPHPTSTSKDSIKWRSSLVIGSGCSTGDHVTPDSSDTCCHRQEILASQSNHWYNRSHVDVTSLLPITPIQVPGYCLALWRSNVT
jgi:hypothetical protein